MSIRYYDTNAKAFFDSTISADMSQIQNRFLRFVRPGGTILDAGCGSGRDAKAFADAGYIVTAFDASIEMVRLAREYSGLPIQHMTFDQMDWTNKFDGIWASASLLHVDRNDLPSTIQRFAQALKTTGSFYLSLKHGEATREVDGRTFTDVTELGLTKLVNDADLQIVEMWMADDVRPGRADRWVNAIAAKA